MPVECQNKGSVKGTFELIPQKSGKVLLKLSHIHLDDDPAVLISVGAGWHTHLGILISHLEGSFPPGFWKVHNRMETDYQNLIPT